VADRVTTRDMIDRAVADDLADAGMTSPALQGWITCSGEGCPTVPQ
jgi:hypothetical protein